MKSKDIKIKVGLDTGLDNWFQHLSVLLTKSKACIDHARQWRLNADPDFMDEGMYSKVSKEIEDFLNTGKFKNNGNEKI